MILTLFLSLCFSNSQRGPSIGLLNSYAEKRNVSGLDEFLAGPPRRVSPFRVLATNGPYEGGRFGWKALEMHTPDDRDLVVFTTPLTMEDTGELVFQRQNGKLLYLPEDDNEHVRIFHHKFKVQIEPTVRNLSVEDEVRFESQTGAGKGFIFRLGPEYTVSKIENYDGVPQTFTQAGGIVALKRPDSLIFGLRITYSGVVDKPNYGGSISGREASLADDYWYPTIARSAAPYEIEIRTPQPWIGLAQGDLVSEKDEANWHTAKYEMKVPCVYFTLSAGKYTTVSKVINNRLYSVYSVGIPAKAFENQAALYAPIFDFYESKFGKYPFREWRAVISTVYGSGALEAYSGATYGNYVPGEDAHETAHTWFGGIVSNSYLHSLWNESFAVYCEGLYAREVPIGNPEERRMAFISVPQVNPDFEEAPCAESGVEIGSAASSLGYGKGAFVLQMLENELGTDKMIACMKRFVEDRSKERTAEWSDFEDAVAKTTGDPHKTFFDQWLRRTGWAKLKVSNVGIHDGAIVGNVSFDGPSYAIRCEAMIEYADGKREFTTIDTSKSSFSLPVHGTPKLLSVDPWRRVLRQIASDEAPASASGFTGKLYRDSAYREYRPELGEGNRAVDFGGDLDGVILVGHPDTFPAMRPLCEKVGFKVDHDKLTYKGTTIDLNAGTAAAVVELPDGKRCMIALGHSAERPSSGNARLFVCDNLGRFLRGETDPKTSGRLTFKL